VSTASLDGIVTSAAIADDDFMSLEFDGFHPAGCELIGAYSKEKSTLGAKLLAK
jgi:hypothetical protein